MVVMHLCGALWCTLHLHFYPVTNKLGASMEQEHEGRSGRDSTKLWTVIILNFEISLFTIRDFVNRFCVILNTP